MVDVVRVEPLDELNYSVVDRVKLAECSKKLDVRDEV